jgi:competence protein ComEA
VKQTTKTANSDNYFHRSQALLWGVTLCVVSALSTLAASAQQAAPQSQQQQQVHQQHNSDLPAGPGKDTFIRTCSKCHSPNNVIANGQNQQGWENTITKMVGFGATGTDDEFSEILDYLVKNFPPASQVRINVNKASAAELEAGLALSEKEAEGIVMYRNKNGDFKSLDDLKKVPQLDIKKLYAKKGHLIF